MNNELRLTYPLWYYNYKSVNVLGTWYIVLRTLNRHFSFNIHDFDPADQGNTQQADDNGSIAHQLKIRSVLVIVIKNTDMLPNRI